MPKTKEYIKAPPVPETRLEGCWGEWVATTEFKDFQRRYNPPSSAKCVPSGESHRKGLPETDQQFSNGLGENLNSSHRNASGAEMSNEQLRSEEHPALNAKKTEASFDTKSNVTFTASGQDNICEIH